MTTLWGEPLSLVPSPREGNGRTLSPAVSFAHIARASPLSCPTGKMMQLHHIFPIDPRDILAVYSGQKVGTHDGRQADVKRFAVFLLALQTVSPAH